MLDICCCKVCKWEGSAILEARRLTKPRRIETPARLRHRQDAVVSLVLSEAVYKQLDAGGPEEGSRAVPLLLRDFPGDLHLSPLRTRWEDTLLGQRCASLTHSRAQLHV